MNRILNQQGYFIVKQETLGEDVDLYQFEPKYSVTISKNEIESFRVFHVAEKDRKEKILKLGLIPKDSRTSFKHKGNRIYLFVTNEPQKYVPNLLKTLSKRVNEKEAEVQKDMIVFEIDKKGISSEDLYLDESFDFKPDYYAVFTLHPIRSNYIKIYEN